MRATAIVLLMVCLGTMTARADAPAPREETIEVIDPGAGRKRTALYLAITGVGLWAASNVVSYIALRNYRKCADSGTLVLGPSCPYDDAASATDYANRQQRIAQYGGTALFAASLVAVGAAAYLRFTVPAKRRVVRVSATPTIAPDSVGVSLGGSF